MSIPLRFSDVGYSDMLRNFSCEIEAGSKVLIVTSREEESTLLLRLISGSRLPEQGSVFVQGRSTKETSPEELMLVRRTLGILPFNGGLISNLKMWDNIFLPFYFHKGKSESVVDETVLNYLQKMNCSGKQMALPAHLSLYEKRVAAFIRAAIMQPDIMIYCNTLEVISKTERTQFSTILKEFHTERADRTSIFLTSASELPVKSDFDAVLYTNSQKLSGTTTR